MDYAEKPSRFTDISVMKKYIQYIIFCYMSLLHADAGVVSFFLVFNGCIW